MFFWPSGDADSSSAVKYEEEEEEVKDVSSLSEMFIVPVWIDCLSQDLQYFICFVFTTVRDLYIIVK